MDFAVVIPDRGDRKHFLDFCLDQVSRFNQKPARTYVMNYDPLSAHKDIIDRVRLGIELAKKDGIEWVFIIENDDYYPVNYIDHFVPFMGKYDFIGQDHTYYYNIRELTYGKFDHAYRSSLFTTAFRVSALNNFRFGSLKPNDFLDIELWKYARHKKRMFVKTGAIGIKHGVGLCGGKGHVMRLKHNDSEMKFLSGHVDNEAFYFYNKMHKTL